MSAKNKYCRTHITSLAPAICFWIPFGQKLSLDKIIKTRLYFLLSLVFRIKSLGQIVTKRNSKAKWRMQGLSCMFYSWYSTSLVSHLSPTYILAPVSTWVTNSKSWQNADQQVVMLYPHPIALLIIHFSLSDTPTPTLASWHSTVWSGAPICGEQWTIILKRLQNRNIYSVIVFARAA